MKTPIAPIAFAVKNARFASKFPNGSDELWLVDLKARRHGEEPKIFNEVAFVESKGTAFIHGIQFKDGLPQGFNPERAKKQQSLVQFLREETKRENDFLGMIARVFPGYGYSVEGKATAAYVASRCVDEPGATFLMGIGYLDESGDYQLIGLDPKEDGWLEAVQHTRPYDSL